MMRVRRGRAFFIALALLLCVGCTAPKEPAPAPTEPPTETPAAPTGDTTPSPTATPTSTPTPAPEPPVDNRFSKNEATVGWINGSGETFPDGSFMTSSLIEVGEGDVVTFAPAVTTQGWHMVVCNEDGKVLRDRTLTSGISIEETLDDTTSIMCYTVKTGEAFIRLVADTRCVDNYIVTVNEPFDADDFYEITNTERPEEEKYEVDEDNPLYGMQVLFCGDSISYGTWDDTRHRAWAGRIAEQYGIIAENQSIGGYCLSTVRGATCRIVNQLYAAKQEEYDMIILEGGINDGWGTVDGTNQVAPVGEMTDSLEREDFDISTFGGALEELFYVARQKFPDAVIGYISTFYMPNATGLGRADDMEEYYALAEEICEKWDVEYLDLYHDEYVTDELLQVRTNTYLRDPIHPNVAGYRRLAPYIGAWMAEIAD